MKTKVFFIKMITVLWLNSSFQLFGQNNSALNVSMHQTTLEFRILNKLNPDDIYNVNEILVSYPGKIVSHHYGENTNKVFVSISDNINPVEVLQLLKLKGITACYRDKDNIYISLEEDGRSIRNLFFKE